jgi:hypothetical protein
MALELTIYPIALPIKVLDLHTEQIINEDKGMLSKVFQRNKVS